MVRAVDLDMAIDATLTEDESAVGRPQKICAVIKAMTLGAKLGPLHFQHKFFGRAMRVMAIETVFAHRRVLPKEWTALLGMTLVAIIVHRIFP